MLRTMVTDFIRNERIKTTDSKAREVQRLAERMISQGKRGTLHSRRLAAAFLTDKSVVSKLFDDVAPRYGDRRGGYTRLTKIGQRKGDAAEIAVLELT
jgi:large subunit ribosomal protein L17